MDDKKKEKVLETLMNSFEEVIEITKNSKGKTPPSFILGQIADDTFNAIEDIENNKEQ